MANRLQIWFNRLETETIYGGNVHQKMKKKWIFPRDCSRQNLHILNDNNLCCLQSKAIIDNCLQHFVHCVSLLSGCIAFRFSFIDCDCLHFFYFSVHRTQQTRLVPKREWKMLFFSCCTAAVPTSVKTGTCAQLRFQLSWMANEKGSLPRAHTQHEHTMNWFRCLRSGCLLCSRIFNSVWVESVRSMVIDAKVHSSWWCFNATTGNILKCRLKQ